MPSESRTLSENELLGLSLPNDAARIADLPDPKGLDLDGVDTAHLKNLAVHFRELWLQLVAESPMPPLSSKDDFATWMRREGSYWVLLRKIGVYYSYALARYAIRVDPDEAIEMLTDPDFGSEEEPDTDSLPELVQGVQKLEGERAYLTLLACWWGLLLATKIDQAGFMAGELPDEDDADLIAFDALNFLEKARGKRAEKYSIYM